MEPQATSNPPTIVEADYCNGSENNDRIDRAHDGDNENILPVPFGTLFQNIALSSRDLTRETDWSWGNKVCLFTTLSIRCPNVSQSILL